MFPLIGSGKLVTAPIISENGEPTQDPIVLQQIYGNNGLAGLLISTPTKEYISRATAAQ